MKPDLPAGWFYPRDVAVYRYIFDALVPEGGRVVEVGTYLGRSLMSVADIVRKKNINVSAIDLFEPYHGDPATDRLERFTRTVAEFGLTENLVIMKGDSVKRATEFVDRSLDFTFIDGDHGYEAVRADIAAWRFKVKSGGWFGGHDYAEVWRAVDENFPRVALWPPSQVWLARNN